MLLASTTWAVTNAKSQVMTAAGVAASIALQLEWHVQGHRCDEHAQTQCLQM